jgi:PAS domain S-box-containing protein
VLVSPHDGVFTLDPSGRILDIDARAQAVFGHGPASATGRELGDLIVPETQREDFRRELSGYLATGDGHLRRARVELMARRADATEFPVALSVTPLRTGARTTFAVWVRDLTVSVRARAAARALGEVGGDLLATHDSRRVTDGIVRTVHELFGTRRAALYERDEESGDLICLAADGDGDTRRWVGQRLPSAHSIAGLAAREGRIVLVPDLHAQSDVVVHGALRTSLEVDEIRSIIAVPLTTRGQTIGVLSLGDHAGRVFTDEDQQLLAAFANQAALALLNTRHYEEVARRRHEAEVAEAEVRRLNAELEQRVVDRTAKLEAAGRELEAFTYTVSHDLKAPLRGMEGFARALQEDYAAGLDARGLGYLEMIQTTARRMGELIDDLLRYSRLDRREASWGPIALRPLIERVCGELEKRPSAGSW